MTATTAKLLEEGKRRRSRCAVPDGSLEHANTRALIISALKIAIFFFVVLSVVFLTLQYIARTPEDYTKIHTCKLFL